MSDIEWIKISTGLFENRKIKQIETLPDKDAILTIWIKILCLAGQLNDNGLLFFTKDVPYTEEMLANEFNRPINTVRLALETFKKFGMLEQQNEVFFIPNWEKYQNEDGMAKVREQNRLRVQRYRDKQKKLLEDKRNVTCNVTVTESNALDIDKEIDKEIDKDNLPTNLHKDNYLLFGKHEHVKLTLSEIRKLNKSFDSERIDLAIIRLDNFIEDKGRHYVSHYDTLRRWMKEDIAKEQTFISSG